jgi:hypothetical protein
MHDLTPDAADDTPKLHVDSDWKAEAERERQRLADAEAKEKARQAEQGGPDGQGQLPEPNFRGLVSMLASQALMGLGTMSDPDSRGVIVDLEGSRFAIDLLGVISEKTAGNLTDEESTELEQALVALRSRYVEIAKLVSEQMASEGRLGEAPTNSGSAFGGGGGIIDPSS